MGLRIRGHSAIVESHLVKNQKDAASSLEKLASGTRFSRAEPQPAERALSDRLTARLKEVATHKRNANDGLSLAQTAEAALSQTTNIVVRLKELATQASNATLSDKERQFLFVEYKGLRDELDRIGRTTTFNGVRLLDEPNNKQLTTMAFRVGPPRESDGIDVNLVRLDDLSEIDATPNALGVPDVDDFLDQEDGVTLDDVEDLFDTSLDSVSTSFDSAMDKIASHRTRFGALEARLTEVLETLDIKQENIAAANSRLIDVDYASEIANLTRANILVQAGASLLSHANQEGRTVLTLLRDM